MATNEVKCQVYIGRPCAKLYLLEHAIFRLDVAVNQDLTIILCISVHSIFPYTFLHHTLFLCWLQYTIQQIVSMTMYMYVVTCSRIIVRSGDPPQGQSLIHVTSADGVISYNKTSLWVSLSCT